MIKYILVKNNVQKMLLEKELYGQFSDGFWENSKNRSWKFFDDTKVIINKIDKKVGFVMEGKGLGYKGYSCNNKDLIECVGDRMKRASAFVRFNNVEDLNDTEYLFIESVMGYNQTIDEERVNQVLKNCERQSTESNYWKEKYEKVTAMIEKYGVDNIVAGMNSKFDNKNLRNNLKDITSALKTRLTHEDIRKYLDASEKVTLSFAELDESYKTNNKESFINVDSEDYKSTLLETAEFLLDAELELESTIENDNVVVSTNLDKSRLMEILNNNWDSEYGQEN